VIEVLARMGPISALVFTPYTPLFSNRPSEVIVAVLADPLVTALPFTAVCNSMLRS
jgi:hypothetical protein